ncbi:MAG: hypothetical protein ABR562_03740 [Thermoplasmatota archaeon]
MIAQTRPDIANITEQTVLALKDLESRISVLKGDLAVLCQGLGHPQAAQLAISPWGSPTNAPIGNSQIGNPYATAQASPFIGATPWGPAYAAPGAFAPSPYASYGAWSPYGPSPFAAIAAPWSQAAFGTFAHPGNVASPFTVPAGYR